MIKSSYKLKIGGTIMKKELLEKQRLAEEQHKARLKKDKKYRKQFEAEAKARKQAEKEAKKDK